MFDTYLRQVNRMYQSGKATEHSYRPYLLECLSAILKNLEITNEPKRMECGAPDFILSRNKIDIGYIETKDIEQNLDRVEAGSEDDDQWARYTKSLDNIILTDFLEFRFFSHGEKMEIVQIAEVRNKSIVPITQNYERLKSLLVNFASFQGETIKSSRQLALMMAHKASLMRDVFYKAVKGAEPSSLKDQLAAFKEVLLHEMDAKQFADVYAQTVAYGLFTARLHDTTKHNFSRGEALTLIPKTNPFLQKLFQYVAGADIDPRVVWIVDALCEVFRAADLEEIMKDFGVSTGKNDPVIHFYETFLAEYDPKLREVRGVYYTPEPVVQFIVRTVDDVLKGHFGLRDGLANTDKVKISVDSDRVHVPKSGKNKGKGIREKDEIDVHKVQILDIATGTGTFICEVIKKVYARFQGQKGVWASYLENDLLPRLHGFELLIAPYAMCHMKIDLLLREMGYDSSNSSKRLNVFLTNTLEEHHKDSHLPFANWLSTEANEASRIKRDIPIMIALGNPPYNKHSSNKSSWIRSLLLDYKKEPGGKEKLKERNSKWLNDDYVKFIRTGEYYIEKNGEGILAYITNHGYLDNPTFRGMRWRLLSTFDDIFVIDLHGNSNFEEDLPPGVIDENVFDIQQGVSIAIFVKKKTKKEGLGAVYHFDLYGSRKEKYSFLNDNSLKDIPFTKIPPVAPNFYFKKKNLAGLGDYNEGFGIDELFANFSTGYYTSCDEHVIGFNKDSTLDTVTKYLKGKEADLNLFKETTYRPFDNRVIYFDPKLLTRSREKFVNNLKKDNNLIFVVGKTTKSRRVDHFFVTRIFSELKCAEYTKGSYMFPLYVAKKSDDGLFKNPDNTMTNLNENIVQKISDIAGPELTPEDIFYYIYAVTYTPHYRKTYFDLLKDGFPKIPYPKNSASFKQLVKYGEELCKTHLLESPKLEKLITQYPIAGDNKVSKVDWKKTGDEIGRVWLNSKQYFDNVPLLAWEFFVGGYQPAQRWLKERQGIVLSYADIMHWQKIIVALIETERLMKVLDEEDVLKLAKVQNAG